METLKIYFLDFFKVLFEILVVQIVITFNKHGEIHLNGRKFQICSKILKTPTWQRKCHLLHVKTVLGSIR